MKYISFSLPTLVLCLFSLAGLSQNLETISKLPSKLKESSGVLMKDGLIWSHNDSQNEPVLYGFDESGTMKSAVYVHAKNIDWEDVTSDEEGNIYIGDFGNQANNRRDLRVLKISDPAQNPDKLADPKVIDFSYSDQKFFPPSNKKQWQYDMEAMVYFEGFLYLFTKNRTEPFDGYTKMYRLSIMPGNHVAELIDSVYLGPEPMISSWVTAADISPDKKKLALLSQDKMWIFSCFKEDHFFQGKKTEIAFPSNTQKEAICFINNNDVYITDELFHGILGGKLYKMDLSGFDLGCD